MSASPSPPPNPTKPKISEEEGLRVEEKGNKVGKPRDGG